jgi:hypothetical protein
MWRIYDHNQKVYFLWRPPGLRNNQHVRCSDKYLGNVYKNVYVDNLLDSFYTEEEANQAAKDSTTLLQRGFFCFCNALLPRDKFYLSHTWNR